MSWELAAPDGALVAEHQELKVRGAITAGHQAEQLDGAAQRQGGKVRYHPGRPPKDRHRPQPTELSPHTNQQVTGRIRVSVPFTVMLQSACDQRNQNRLNPETMSSRERNSSSHTVRTGRWMARRDEPFAIFVFGMRLNRLRGLPRFLWGLRVLRRVLRDLNAHPEHGYLTGRVYRAGRTLIAVQYWESFDALDAWARDHRLPHRKPWQQYLREALDDGAMGLWHETYLASPGSWEGVYLNMPPWGLAAGVEAVELQATKGSARERLREQRKRATQAAAEKPPPPPP